MENNNENINVQIVDKKALRKARRAERKLLAKEKADEFKENHPTGAKIIGVVGKVALVGGGVLLGKVLFGSHDDHAEIPESVDCDGIDAVEVDWTPAEEVTFDE